MLPKIGRMVEVVTDSGKVLYLYITAINHNHPMGETVYTCKSEYGNSARLTKREFRVVKTKAGSLDEVVYNKFKG